MKNIRFRSHPNCQPYRHQLQFREKPINDEAPEPACHIKGSISNRSMAAPLVFFLVILISLGGIIAAALR